jgi:hypothetical protein
MEPTLQTNELVTLARQIVTTASDRDVPVRVLGGVAIELMVPDRPTSLRRSYGDIDMAAPRGSRKPVEEAMRASGLRAEERFNKVQGALRQVWWTADGRAHVDVFLGEFVMCHRLLFEGRFLEGQTALPAADVLLMKLQVVELNLKDATDASALLLSHRLGHGDEEGVINVERIASVLSDDWGFYTTATDNLERIPEVIREVDPEIADSVRRACEQLRDSLEAAPKSRAFKLRARVGRRKRWYELPEESL